MKKDDKKNKYLVVDNIIKNAVLKLSHEITNKSNAKIKEEKREEKNEKND